MRKRKTMMMKKRMNTVKMMISRLARTISKKAWIKMILLKMKTMRTNLRRSQIS